MTKTLQKATFTKMLSPLQAAAATAALTATLDCKGADYAVVLINVGIEKNTDSTNVVCSLTEGDDTNTFVTFDSNFTSITVDNTAAALVPWNINRANGARKRYLKLTCTPDTTTNGNVSITATGVLLPERGSASVETNEVVG